MNTSNAEGKKKGTKFVIRKGGKVEAIYSDKDRNLLDHLKHEENRASHVDPLNRPVWSEWFAFWRWRRLYSQSAAFSRFGVGHWAIFWKGEVSSWQPVFNDTAGQPFRTKREAELFEVAMLERDYFHVRPGGPLYIEVLKKEQPHEYATGESSRGGGAQV